MTHPQHLVVRNRAGGSCLPGGRSDAPPAFTLVEVLLALGIVAFAFMALCGVLPVGLQSYRGAMDATHRANIVQRVSGELEQASFADLPALAGTVRYFDSQGNEASSEHAARFRVAYESVAPGATVFGATNTSLRPVTLAIYLVQGDRLVGRSTLFVADDGR